MTEKPIRKQTRLKDYDYSQNGCYFVTICTYERQQIFVMSTFVENNLQHVGNDLCVVPKKALQNIIIEKWISELQNKFSVKIENYVIMPDHIHLLLNITERHVGRSLPDMMQWFKTMTTNEYIKKVKENIVKPFDKKLWQKSYYEHIIRDENDYKEKLEYIINNPLKKELF